jgi:two-component system nitrogen regulation sensor histidine kinase GlnL
MNGFKFTVDRNLIIRSVDIPRDDMGRLCAAVLVGQPYRRFFPVILESGKDAVEKVLQEGVPLFIRGGRTICFCGEVQADLSITTLLAADGSITGAEISREINSGCQTEDTMRRERRLIDIGRSSATLAHGVRNPLNAIKGAVVYLKDTYGKEPTLVEFAEIIEDEISKLDGFITRFLSTSLLESESVPLDVNELLRRILAMNSFQAYAKKVIFDVAFGEMPRVRADTFQLEHAVMNVINNALEAMGEGGVLRLKTKTARRSDRYYACIEISDTGRGMVRTVLHDVSDGEGKRRRDDGRGFGLFITREIVQSHGGHLEISSRKDIGTTVRIFIPADAV